jgi:hypothetical protein
MGHLIKKEIAYESSFYEALISTIKFQIYFKNKKLWKQSV